MKYEITKGSEKDFEGAPEWATLLTKTGGQMFFVEKHEARARVLNVDTGEEDKIDKSPMPGLFDNIKIIAERRPITEPSINKSSWRETAQVGTQSVESEMKNNAQWDGEGLPPVGALCRYRGFSDMPWVECKVLAWHDDEVWLKRVDDGKTFTMGNPELFPIRSHEDVARDEAIEAMRDVVLASDQSLTCYESLYNAIAAGKIPGVKLE